MAITPQLEQPGVGRAEVGEDEFDEDEDEEEEEQGRRWSGGGDGGGGAGRRVAKTDGVWKPVVCDDDPW